MDRVNAHLDRGWDLVHRGDLKGAMRSAEKVLAIDGASPEAHNLVGFILASEGRVDEAINSYRRSIELDPAFVEPRLNAADLLIHPLGRIDDALVLMSEALDLAHTDDERAEVLLVIFDAHMHRGNHEAAARLLNELPAGPFESAPLVLAIGRAYFDAGRIDEAEAAIRGAMERGLRDADCYYYLGMVHDARGQTADAVIAFLQARELEAQSPPLPTSLPRDRFERIVRACIRRLPAELSSLLEGTLVVVSDLPGAEVVADGLDPRTPALMTLPHVHDDEPLDGEEEAHCGHLHTPCLFVYQRNIERMGGADLDQTIDEVVRDEIGRMVGDPGELS